ncbi:hypothetical protein BCR36DRAFT_375406 [Piromyces finnis]|uniref:DNA glycosylase n=1 Tax=Piromyces finnis TaxID=1754191 RepID=A0A1Y1UTH7_9FUNG|nr:hypothetical protein BCR36DRAFT_375406 [Piromyces finnis]|eukprot:ORX41321.1 hypothetical protein BCR36DRAFT_375406 [Piromyces finnis]
MSLKIISGDVTYMSWDNFFIKNSKLVLHIYNQLKNTYFTPLLEDVFRIFKYVQLSDIKVVMIGDMPYKNTRDISDIAFGTRNCDPPLLLESLYKNLEDTVALSKTKLFNIILFLYKD